MTKIEYQYLNSTDKRWYEGACAVMTLAEAAAVLKMLRSVEAVDNRVVYRLSVTR